MTANIYPLSAGSGYEYLTRSICCDDATGRGGQGLASYYAEKGDVPGRFMGRGLVGIDGIDEGDRVTAEHMKALFGAGMHPLAIERNRAFDALPSGQGPTRAERIAATHLGRRFKVCESTSSPFAVEVARRRHAFNKARDLPRDARVPDRVRAAIRSAVARDFFVQEYGRAPDGPRELFAMVAKHSRPVSNAVAGFDITFSPVKSVSTLWALAEEPLAAQIERAHNQALADALRWMEDHALFTREGTNGVRQVETRGMVATAFTHRDSRAGDPDLHTHVVVANKVQTLQGKWLTLDSRALHKATVSISETYNSALERYLEERLGVRFEERPDQDRRKRRVREIVGVDPQLNQRFSKRRRLIEARRDQLAAAFQHDHGRPPTPKEAIELAQQATLETREGKHDPRTLAEQRAAWRTEALEVLGSEQAITQMVRGTLTNQGRRVTADADWLESTAKAIAKTLEGSRSVWQYWHAYAEAQRRIRETSTPADQIETVADTLAARVLNAHSVSLDRPRDPVREPTSLRRRDGTSVYRIAGSAMFTSSAILAAERRVLEAAGRRDGMALSDETVAVALLECTANEVGLNPGQACLVRDMATSGLRVQLAIAPAGSGKTTAMRALAAAWTSGGGTVLGLAPSAVAAAELGAQIGTGQHRNADTLAKLVHGLDVGELPDWAEAVGPKTLLVIDEAGMADTISLDRAVAFALSRGASMRLIGDDQQLAAIGAGGLLRDIHATHGALQLSQLMRFRSVAEGNASLALRDGRAEALGFYLDHHRVHVGDQATMADAVFSAWANDHANGLQPLMLAPTRDLVAELNQRARLHRLTTEHQSPSEPSVRLGDGNLASVGDLIITRTNDRTLRVSATDWVKNGDRWKILGLHERGIRVQHHTSGRIVFLPTSYVAASTDLGYACTVHTAQGVTADTTHGLVTGSESRQQLYTLATRGRVANHLYVTVASDGDPHNLLHPDVINPKTATEILESILARDGSPNSATTGQREAYEPARRLLEATERYTDALHHAAETRLGEDTVGRIEHEIEMLVPGVTGAAAWPTLRANLIMLAANGVDVIAVNDADLHGARDLAAVLDWRLDPTGHKSFRQGPLPWLPGIPRLLSEDPEWGSYLSARADLVNQLATEVGRMARKRTLAPAWAPSAFTLAPEVAADVEVWRAATGVAAEDLRPTGPATVSSSARQWQRSLDRRVVGPNSAAIKEWGSALSEIHPRLVRDPFSTVLAQRLAALSRAGINTRTLLDAARDEDLPDDHAAAALWWRLSAQITPAAAARINQQDPITNSQWMPELEAVIGSAATAQVLESAWWPALVAAIDQGLQRGWTLPNLLALDTAPSVYDEVDLCQALVWRTSIALTDIPDLEHHNAAPEPDEPPDDIYADWTPPQAWMLPSTDPATAPPPPPEGASGSTPTRVDPIDRGLLVAAMSRDLRVITEEQLATPADLRRQFARAREWDHTSVTRERMIAINIATQAFFEKNFPDSWAQRYLTRRFGFDLHRHELVQPGYAPAGWTHLVDHLRTNGVSEEEMLATGVASLARSGRLIDRFRDRVTFPITNQRGEILGFVARRHPSLTDAPRMAGPKYLNTSDTPLFHKGAQLFGLTPAVRAGDPQPVLVEGPMDAIAVTLATAGLRAGVAPLGTALTDDQAIQLARLFQTNGWDPVVCTDSDPAGRAAAARDFWILAGVGLDPAYARLPDGDDPSSMLQSSGAAALASALHQQVPLATELLAGTAQRPEALVSAVWLLGASNPDNWDDGVVAIARAFSTSEANVRRALLYATQAWETNPRAVASRALTDTSRVDVPGVITSLKQRSLPGDQPAEDLWKRISTAVGGTALRQDKAASASTDPDTDEASPDTHPASAPRR